MAFQTFDQAMRHDREPFTVFIDKEYIEGLIGRLEVSEGLEMLKAYKKYLEEMAA